MLMTVMMQKGLAVPAFLLVLALLLTLGSFTTEGKKSRVADVL